MSPLEHAEQLAAPYGPLVPLSELVEKLNQIYHRYEAATYDTNHSEIFDQLPDLWAEMVSAAQHHSYQEKYRILDYGCGTGFAAAQVLKALGPDGIELLVCYDMSPEMLDRCRQRFHLQAGIRFTTQPPIGEHFDLLLTNSFLHHLPNLDLFIKSAPGFLADDGLWLAGHEPNRRYYQNKECLSLLSRLAYKRKLKKILSVSGLMRFISSRLGVGHTINHQVADAAVAEKLFARRPRPLVIERLVDFSVPHNEEEASAGRGIDFGTFSEIGSVDLLSLRSYNYMGSHYEAEPSREMKDQLQLLSEKYPKDAAHTAAIFQKRRDTVQ